MQTRPRGRRLAAPPLLLAAALVAVPAAHAQAPPQLVFTTDHEDAAIYIDGVLACRHQCAIQQGVPGASYSVTCQLEGYDDGVASGIFPAEGTVVVRCPLEPTLTDIATLEPAEGGMPPPEVSVALTPAIVDAVVVSSPGLQRCFLEAEDRGETHAGKLWVRFWVTPDGSAGNARFETEGYEGTVIHDCVIDELTRLRFPPYSGNEGKSIRFPLVPGRIRNAGTGEGDADDSVFVSAAGGPPGLTPAVVVATVARNETIAACVEDARERQRLGRDGAWLTFTVEASGAVTGAEFGSSKVDGRLQSCVLEQVRRLWFPATASYPQTVTTRLGGE